MNTRIVVAGSLNMDLVAYAPRIPQPGETVIAGAFQTTPGGKGANQAVAAARLGAAVSMIGKTGTDAFGQELRQSLEAAGVRCRFVSRDADAPTGVALITVDATGQNSIVVASGANMQLSPADIDAAEDVIAAAGFLLLQLESPLETVTHAATVAQRHGVRVILNPAPARALPTELLQMVDVLIPNETETASLTGLPVETPQDAEVAGAALLARGVGAVIITLGARGALLVRDREAVHSPAFPVVAVDTTAAGDAFIGGLALALSEGQRVPEAMRWGCAAGAIAAARAGAQSSLPDRGEVEAMLRGANSLPG
jgi:ribokinase